MGVLPSPGFVFSVSCAALGYARHPRGVSSTQRGQRRHEDFALDSRRSDNWQLWMRLTAAPFS